MFDRCCEKRFASDGNAVKWALCWLKPDKITKIIIQREDVFGVANVYLYI